MIWVKGIFVYLLKNIFRKVKNYIVVSKFRHKQKIFIGRNCNISPDLICGNNIKIGNYVNIGRNVILEDNVKIGGFSILKNIKIGKNSQIESNVKVIGSGNGKIIIGKESYIGFNLTLDISEDIYIGDFVHIGSNIWTHSSAKQAIAGLPLSNKDKKYRPTAPVKIENNVYLGVNSIINPGIIIKNHSIIAPNSAVTKDVEPYTIVGGVPAKVIKTLPENLK